MALDAEEEEEEDEEEVKKAAGAILKLHATRPSRPSVSECAASRHCCSNIVDIALVVN